MLDRDAGEITLNYCVGALGTCLLPAQEVEPTPLLAPFLAKQEQDKNIIRTGGLASQIAPAILDSLPKMVSQWCFLVFCKYVETHHCFAYCKIAKRQFSFT